MYSYSNRFAVSTISISYLLFFCMSFQGGIIADQARVAMLPSSFFRQPKVFNGEVSSLPSVLVEVIRPQNLFLSVNYNKHLTAPLFKDYLLMMHDSSMSFTNKLVFRKHEEEYLIPPELLSATVPLMIDESNKTKVAVFTAHDGYEIIFIYKQKRWMAYVIQHLAIGYRILILPVYGEFGFNMSELLSSAVEWQKRHIYVCFPTVNAEIKTMPYVYITRKELQDSGIKIDVKNTIVNLMAGYYLATLSKQIEPATLERWRNMLKEIDNLLGGIKLNLAVVSIDPNPGKIKNQLEQIIYRYLNRQVKLEQYAVTYNQIRSEIIRQIETKYSQYVYDASRFSNDYLVTLEIKLGNIYSLLLEFEKIKGLQQDEVVRFDLTKILDVLGINVTSKGPSNDQEALSGNIDPLISAQRKEEIKLSTIFPSLPFHSSEQALLSNTGTNYFGWGDQVVNIYTDNVDLYVDEYELPNRMHIPSFIRLATGDIVKITFGNSLKNPENVIVSADRLIDQRLIPSLIGALNKANEMVKIESIHISATTNGHDGKQYANSNHRKENGARAIDISRINGRNISDLGGNHPLVIALQTALDETSHVRENFGPYFRHKKRKVYTNNQVRQGHKNHIHFSINR